jgi:hypothetical protein
LDRVMGIDRDCADSLTGTASRIDYRRVAFPVHPDAEITTTFD